STLAEAGRRGLRKQMENSIEILQESLAFRMRGAAFDTVDMYVAGHTAACDVRDERGPAATRQDGASPLRESQRRTRMPPNSSTAAEKSAAMHGFEFVKRGALPVSPPSPIK